MFTSETVGFLGFLTVMMFIAWRFYGKEQVQNNFLRNKLKTQTEEEASKKSKKRLELEQELEKLNNPLTYNQLIFCGILVGFLVFMLFSMADFALIGIVFACIIGFFIPKIIIAFLKDRRLQKFSQQLPDALSQLLATLQAGQTPVQGFKMLAEHPYPIGAEFEKVYIDINTGASVEDALNDLYKRNPINDVKLLITGLIVAQNATLSVAINTLQVIVKTIRQRDSQKKSSKSAVAQGKLTAIVLALMPVAVFLGLEFMSPTYINEFLATELGKMCFGAAAILDMIGFFIAMKITSASNIVDY